ncbi:hypothetical protein [Rhodoferax sp.]|uniref:hypothetical protein n=1 Tax=Rhodoferax sp. TaxID=50421 RepID=UPI00374DA587
MTITQLPGTIATKPCEPGPDVCGCLTTNWMPNAPAVLVNPSASPIDLLGWCHGEVESLRATAAAVSIAECALRADDLNAIFYHRLVPLEAMLRHALDRLVMQKLGA